MCIAYVQNGGEHISLVNTAPPPTAAVPIAPMPFFLQNFSEAMTETLPISKSTYIHMMQNADKTISHQQQVEGSSFQQAKIQKREQLRLR